MLYMIKRDSMLVKTVAEREMVCQATFQVSKIDPKPKYTNIAIQKLTIFMNGKIYHMDHVWLQEQDYPTYFKDMAVEGKWYDMDFVFYPYRDKITENADGIKMHGIDALEIYDLDREDVIADLEKSFEEVKDQYKFIEFK